MKTRQRIFWGLSAFVVFWMLMATATIGNVGDEMLSTPVPGSMVEAREAGVAMGQGMSFVMVFCVGGFFFTICALLAWRNGAGLESKRRHIEKSSQMKLAKRRR